MRVSFWVIRIIAPHIGVYKIITNVEETTNIAFHENNSMEVDVEWRS